MKMDGKEVARANLERRRMNQQDGDDAPKEVQGEIQDQGAHIKEMMDFIECVHGKDASKAHEAMARYASAYSKMKSE